METKAKETNHAERNARGWVETIAALVSAMEADYDRLQELRDEREACETDEERAEWDKEHGDELRELVDSVTVDGDEMTDADAARERAEESALSVQVRSGWVNPGKEMKAEEFEILLTTGGPALRIRGELDGAKDPCRAWLEYQDWGTPWTQYFDVEADTLLKFCSVFYFGA